jgi:NAD(P)-dependent dehydrogenase (short-subunit alcohol dehydrogenase family)
MRTVIVGASSGLGRCIGIDRGRRGDRVALLARRHDRLVAAATEAGEGTLAIACDVNDEKSGREAIEEAAAGLGGIDALVYATGIGPLMPIETVDSAIWRRAFDTNVVGAAVVTSAALPYLRDAGGVAVYLSSISASQTPPWPGFSAYTVSKAAMDKLIDAFRVEHPSVGFTRVVVGDCVGGEGHGQSEFLKEDAMEYAGQMIPVWMQRGYMTGALMEVEELISGIDAVLRSAASIPSIVITPRPPRP